MKTAAIISIGNELLNGRTIDTNTAYIGKILFSLGIEVKNVFVVADEIEKIVTAFQRAQSQADFVITTGGLGPTSDDLTRDGFSKFLGVDLQFHAELFEGIEEFFKKRGRKIIFGFALLLRNLRRVIARFKLLCAGNDWRLTALQPVKQKGRAFSARPFNSVAS